MNFYGTSSEYDKKFNSTIPKKQAKSYEVDLGQNNGPFKEDLLIRYGDNTLHHKINRDDTNGTNVDILRMNEVLRPYQERTAEHEEDNVNDQCFVIEDNLNFVEDENNELKELEEALRKLIEMTTNDIFKIFDDAYNEFNPEMLAKYKYLKTHIKDQKDENANLLKQIDLLNQEISTIFENIIKLGGRLETLEKVCGVDKQEYEEEESDDD